MKTFLLKILPFLTSIFIGVVLFLIAEHQITDAEVSTLIIGVASGLCGIPIVFIFYQMASDYSERKIRKVVAEHIIFEMNYIIIQLLKDLKAILNFKKEFTKENLYSFLAENKDLQRKKLSFTKNHMHNFAIYKTQILQIVYSNSKLEVIPDIVVHTILSLAKEIGIVSKELEAKNNRRNHLISVSLENLINDIDNWIEFCELEAVTSHHTFTLAS